MNYKRDKWKDFISEDFERPEKQLEKSGIILLDKPPDISSMDVLRYIKKIGAAKKAGHGGTLDPFATGLLVVLLNKATKLSEKIMAGMKEYEGTFILGSISDTQDITGQIQTETEEIPDFSAGELQNYAKKLTGHIQQIPPQFSAKKVDGVRLYKKAREGIKVEIKPHNVFVEEFKITEKLSNKRFSYHIRCGKGTYVRTLVHDLGKILNTGAVTESLRRTKAGPFSAENSYKLSDLRNQEQISAAVIPLENTGSF